jgi:DNA-binding XRE family transcriptional regulator
MTVSIEKFMEDFTSDQRERVQTRVAELIAEETTLRDLRQARHLTQERMAALLGVQQENVSRLERRADLLLSTLSSYVGAMGGKLRLIAEFPNRPPVTIALADITDAVPPRQPRRTRPAKRPIKVAKEAAQ